MRKNTAVFTAKSPEADQTTAINEVFHPSTYRIDQIRGRLQKQAEGQPRLHSHRCVRCLSPGNEPPFSFCSASGGAGSIDQAKAVTSEAADAAVGFWFFWPTAKGLGPRGYER